jgi:hypothetical protein
MELQLLEKRLATFGKTSCNFRKNVLQKTRMTEDLRGTRYRIEGPTFDGRIIHVICRFKESVNLIIITVYAL